jgi:sugar/nucleoside kinase (ribokinase family)
MINFDNHHPVALTMGELLIDFVGEPAGAGMAETEVYRRKAGGAPANVAVGLRRLGIPSAFMGMVGADHFGEFLRDTLSAEGVDVRGLRRTTDQPTSLAFVALSKAGVPDFVFVRHPGADQSFTAEHVDESLFEGALLFHFGSLSLARDPVRGATFRALQLARAHGLFVSYDPNDRPALWGSRIEARTAMLAPLPMVDAIKVSEEELRLLTGSTDVEEGAAALMSQGPRHVLVTRGEGGMVAIGNDFVHEVAGEPVEAIDTTGCGDTSVAGFFAWLLHHDALPASGGTIAREASARAADFANACAAVTAQGVGAIPSMPRLDQMRANLEA